MIEDCAQAPGATVDGRPVGAYADLAAFSFCQDKILTTGGEGGLLTLDDEDMWRARRLGLQGQRQEIRGHLRTRAPARLPLRLRIVRHQLAHAPR